MNDCQLNDCQLTNDGKLKHFITTEGLPTIILEQILDTAVKFLKDTQQKKTKSLPLLRGKTVINLFFEDSTRTSTSFELAAKKLSATVVTLDTSRSSMSKGEGLADTIRTIEAMGADIFVIRHSDSGTAHFVAQQISPEVSVINAGDGQHAHPTQAMLDALTIYLNKGNFDTLSLAIVGDVAHSRVARSEIHAFKTLGIKDIRLIAPPSMLPEPNNALGVPTFTSLSEGLYGVDVIIMLRIQKERIAQNALFTNELSYFFSYGLNKARLKYAKDDAIIMHPGPINRGVEIAADLADSERSVILQQVHLGIATRMSIFTMVASSQETSK